MSPNTALGLLIVCVVAGAVVWPFVRLANAIDSVETKRAAGAWMGATRQVDLYDAWNAAGQPNLYSRNWAKSGLTKDHQVAWHAALYPNR